MYYAFFGEFGVPWKGQIELRGLRSGKYRVFNYVDGKDLGVIDAAQPEIGIEFTQHLLLETTRLTEPRPSGR
jgi:alpha-galactosidase